MVNILALVAHGDDEVIGCGGALARHVQEGDAVFLVVMADGVSSRQSGQTSERDRAIRTSCDILGIQLLHRFDFKDNQLDVYPLLELVQAVETVINPMVFDVVYTHSKKDLNVDHRMVHDTAMTVFRPVPDQKLKAIFAFETLSATHWYNSGGVFSPQRFVDVTSFWKQKMQALEAYGPELHHFPHARSREAVLAMARFRGCLAGRKKAEAFEILRMVE